MKRLALSIVTLTLACWSVAPAASAQIFTWRDANGNLVLSDTPPSAPAGPVRTFRVANTLAGVRTTRPASNNYRQEYDDLIQHHAREQGIRPDLVRAVVQVESGYNPRARSPKGAMGLMQLMPGTAADLGVTRPYDPDQNIKGGVRYLRGLLERYDQNEELALAAYNAGPEAVNRYGNTVPPYRETRDYVRKVKTRTLVSNASVTRHFVYRTVEVVDGREITRYSDSKPASGPYQVFETR